MKKRVIAALIMAVCLPLFALAVPTFATAPSYIPEAVWADGTLFYTSTVKTPQEGEFYTLYSFAQDGLEGQHSILAVMPGGANHEGDPWIIFPVFFTRLGMDVHDQDHNGVVDFELTSEAELTTCVDKGHLVINSKLDQRSPHQLLPKE